MRKASRWPGRTPEGRCGMVRNGSMGLSERNRKLFERAIAPAGSALAPVRLLVVLAHPDDEVLAIGARLERLHLSRLLTVTDGAPGDGADARQHGFPDLAAYRAARLREQAAALAHAGLPAAVAAPFGPPVPVPDQEAALHLPQLTRGLCRILEEFAPEAVLTHPYEGGHPDHDACAFLVHTAVRLHAARAGSTGPSPLLLEAPFYSNNGTGGMRTGVFLPEQGDPPAVLALSEAEQRHKRERLACFTSQTQTLAQFPTDRELFRPAPRYNFTRPPHAGELLYEHWGWSLTGERFRQLAAEAEEALFGGENRPDRAA